MFFSFQFSDIFVLNYVFINFHFEFLIHLNILMCLIQFDDNITMFRKKTDYYQTVT